MRNTRKCCRFANRNRSHTEGSILGAAEFSFSLAFRVVGVFRGSAYRQFPGLNYCFHFFTAHCQPPTSFPHFLCIYGGTSNDWITASAIKQTSDGKMLGFGKAGRENENAGIEKLQKCNFSLDDPSPKSSPFAGRGLSLIMLPGYSIGSAFIQPMVHRVHLASGRSHPDAGITKETETCSPFPISQFLLCKFLLLRFNCPPPTLFPAPSCPPKAPEDRRTPRRFALPSRPRERASVLECGGPPPLFPSGPRNCPSFQHFCFCGSAAH